MDDNSINGISNNKQKKNSPAKIENDIDETSQPRIEPQPQYQQPIKERVIVKYEQPKKGGCLNLGCGCQSMACGGCLFFIIFIIGFIFVLITKPPIVWNLVVNFLNADIVVPQYKLDSSDTVKSQLNNEIQSVGDLDIAITQEQLTAIARDKITNLKNLVIQVKPDVIVLYWDMDSTLPDNPLKGVIEMRFNNESGKLELSKVGTGRLGAPEFMNQFITKAFYTFLNSTNGTSTDNKYGFLSNIIPSNSVNIKSIKFEEGKIHIIANIQVDLFQQ